MNVVAAMYERWARGEGGDGDSWGDITTEPGGVDYLEVEADGVPAMWIEPHGAARDRVIVYLHGGGFVGGSLYTHRKLVAHLAKAAGVRPCWCTTGCHPRRPIRHRSRTRSRRTAGWLIRG